MKYSDIIKHYESCFYRYGDTAKGVDWTQESQVDTRYKTMLEVINFREKTFEVKDKISLLDYGCGLSHLYEYIQRNNIDNIDYTGLELSKLFYDESRKKYPANKYLLGDILVDDDIISNSYDYIVMNGVFTEKVNLSYDEMFKYFASMISKVYSHCNKGLAFNVMSKQVDWEKEFLFHVPLNDMADYLTHNVGRDFIIRNDYGLYEYTVYVYR